MRWQLPELVDSLTVSRLAEELRIAPFLASILWTRGIREPAQARDFLDPRLGTLSDPFLLPDMEEAVARVFAAIDQKEKIVIYGDYDVDGVTSLTLLTRVLTAFGARPECFLPLRLDEGYGLSTEGLARCLAEHAPKLLIAVDCGTSSCAELAELGARSIDAIVLDHHECKAALPKCVALVNPKRAPGFHYLCSVGLVFKLAHALLKRRPVAGFDLRAHLDLVAIGTIADLVPLIAENRILVKRGLTELARTTSPGIRALIEVAGLRPPFACGDIAFGLAPRLNAAGRLGTAQQALELLLTDDAARARTLAVSLDVQNRERRAVEDRVFAEAEAQLASSFDPARHAAIVVGASGWHPGVIGIVASRLLRRHHRPTIVIGFDETGLGKGSGRSIDGLSLVQALGTCGSLLEKYGGHEMAAGVTLRVEQFASFCAAFGSCARECLSDEQLQPRLRVDAELKLEELDFALLQSHAALQPFGMANPEPLFLSRQIFPVSKPRLLKDKHLSLVLRQGERERRAIWFNAVTEELPDAPWDIAFTLERNEYQGVVMPQIQLKAVRSAQ